MCPQEALFLPTLHPFILGGKKGGVVFFILRRLNHSVGILFLPGCDTVAGDWQRRLQIISSRIA